MGEWCCFAGGWHPPSTRVLFNSLCATVTAVLVCTVVTCYCIRAVNSSKIVAWIRNQNFAIFRTLRRKFCPNTYISCKTFFFLPKLLEYNANTNAYSALMLTESEYIACVQRIISGTTLEVAEQSRHLPS